MLKALFGPSTLTSMLRGGLEEASATHRAIAQRVAGVLSASSSVEFPDALAAQAAQKPVSEADLERDMTALADTQLRYEADATLLKAAYARLRTAVHDRG
jgi:flagellar basal body rod protein FlgB